jgi:hypothetical protein
MIHKLVPSILFPIRNYRPAVSPANQEKILAIRSELAALGVATGRSRAKRNGMSAGTSGIGLKEAIERLREADSKLEKPNGYENSSLMLNVQVKLLKEQYYKIYNLG